MISFRRVLGLVLAALTLAAFTLPAAAADNKVYTLNMAASLTAGTSGQAVTATFGNVSPVGNSTFNSLKLYAPADITITGVTVPTGFTATATIRNAAGAIVAQGTSVWVDAINLPVKPGGPKFVLGLTVTANCTGGGDWTTLSNGKQQVWTGSSWTGSNFSLTSPSNVTTNFSGSCPKVTTTSNGNGTINPTWTNQTVLPGATPSFTFTPATDYLLSNVSGCGGALTGGTFTTAPVNESCTVTATFTHIPVTLTYRAGPNGRVSGNLTQTVAYATGTGTPVEAVGSPGYRFINWSDNSTANPRTDSNQTTNLDVTAKFALNTFSLTSTTSGAAAGTSTSVPLVLTNLGGPAITSATINAPAGVTIKTASLGTPAADGKSVTLTGISVGTLLPLNLGVDVACTPSSSTGGWTVTGVSPAGFTQDPAFLGFNITGSACSLGFEPVVPTSATVNEPFTLNVALTGGSGYVPWFNGPVTVYLGTACSGTQVGSGTASAGYVSISASIATAGTTSLTACATPSGSTTQVATTLANFTVYGGTLGCNDTNNSGGDLDPNLDAAYTLKSLQGKWGLIRGVNKPGGDECIPVPYTFTLDIGDPPGSISPQTASFIVPTSPPFGTQKVAVQYVVVWGRVAVNTAELADKGWTAKRPNLSWGFASPVIGANPPQYVPALACVLDPLKDPDVPGSKYFADVASGDLESLMPVLPSVVPFSTSPYEQYQSNGTRKAKMCIAQQGWTAVGTDGTNTLIQYWSNVIDLSDGFMSLD